MIRQVACAISGGVDSAVAALLLKRKGFSVCGVFMRNWDIANETGVCIVDQDREDAKYVCDYLQIPFVEVNFVKEYWNDVFSRMVQGYESGLTPNPDVLCNKYIKFGHLYHYAMTELKMDAVATGHYARNSYGQFLENTKNCTHAQLLQSVDQKKDQTLFLCNISRNTLQNTMFPIGGFYKTQVKEIATESGLIKIAKKKESMGICFIGSRNFQSFIEDYIEPKPGYFVDIETGKIVGKHKGTHYWTIGQRTHIGGLSEAFFVARVDHVSQNVLVAAGTGHPALFSDNVIISRPLFIERYMKNNNLIKNLNCQFRFQHADDLSDCQITQIEQELFSVKISQPLRALTPGQYAVFYHGLECLGGAEIVKIGPTMYDLQGKTNLKSVQ